MCVDWTDPSLVKEAYEMLKVWEPMAPADAICLLDAPFGDMKVRLYACGRI